MHNKSGKHNPNNKYDTDQTLFENVDGEAKAYALGLIASDGTIKEGSIQVALHKKDVDILEQVKSRLALKNPIKTKNKTLRSLTIHSKKICSDVAALLGLDMSNHSKKKDKLVRMPTLATRELQLAFIRGYFDGDGSINDPAKNNHRSPQVSIASQSDFIRSSIVDSVDVPCKVSDCAIWWFGNNALEFLSKMYDNSTIHMRRKHDLYLQWCMWTPSLLKGTNIRGKIDGMEWAKVLPSAVKPSKARITDSGYDLTLIDILKCTGDVVFYRTGVKVRPPYGYYFDLVPRSSISKTGYMLANSVGVIDRCYTGEILVPLRKVDKTAPDLELPAKVVQIIPREIIHVQFVEVSELTETSRGDGGFGSTGKISTKRE